MHLIVLSIFLIYPLLSFQVQQCLASSPLGAYNPQLNNTFPQDSGPVIPYNGSGDVPALYTLSPEPEPLPSLSLAEIEDAFFAEIIAAGSAGTIPESTNCSQCIGMLEAFHLAALTQSPTTITNLLVRACDYFNWPVNAATCESEFSKTGGTGPYLAQVFRWISLATQDMQAFCHYEFSLCDLPPVVGIDESEWFSPKPADKTTAPSPSGRTLQVLHFSDWHLDPRFDIGSEANCSQSMCCRVDSTNTAIDTAVNNASLPASRWGDFLCDTTADLGLSAFASMHHFLDINKTAFSIFTGDIVSHDPDDQQSIAYVEYEENIAYKTFKAQLPGIPLYATLGNHDSIPSGYNAPNNINNGTAPNPMSWNYQLLSSLWESEGWISNSTARYASTHYGAYATTTKEGLKIISYNSDFYYTPNPYAWINFTNPDVSGTMRFIISELEAAEQANQRVWLIAHVPSGGGSATTNPSALFASIVRRFSPATIAGVFYGHTHQDSKSIYYDLKSSSSSLDNTTDIDYSAPLNVAWICPSIAPRTNYNSGWTVYHVDASTFSVIDSQTYFANISDSHSVKWNHGPEWRFEYDTRQTYDANGTWPKDAPLNATFFDMVTKKMESDPGLVDTYSFLETKKSNQVPLCSDDACRESVICVIRSGSAAEASLC